MPEAKQMGTVGFRIQICRLTCKGGSQGMKKCRNILSWLLILSVCLICCSALADGESNLWYFPQCGRLNDANYCPVDGIPKPDMSSSASSSGVSMPDRFYDYCSPNKFLKFKRRTE